MKKGCKYRYCFNNKKGRDNSKFCTVDCADCERIDLEREEFEESKKNKDKNKQLVPLSKVRRRIFRKLNILSEDLTNKIAEIEEAWDEALYSDRIELQALVKNLIPGAEKEIFEGKLVKIKKYGKRK